MSLKALQKIICMSDSSAMNDMLQNACISYLHQKTCPLKVWRATAHNIIPFDMFIFSRKSFFASK